MDSLIDIGGKVDKNTAENIAMFVERVFKSGRDNHMDQLTIVAALQLVGKVASGGNSVTLENCHIEKKKAEE